MTDRLILCDTRRMSIAAAIASDRAARPGATRAWARASATLNAVASLVILVLDLLGHAKPQVLAFCERFRRAACGVTGRWLGSNDLHVIATRIVACGRRGAMRCAALPGLLWCVASRRACGPQPALLCDRMQPEQYSTHVRVGAWQDGLPGSIGRLGRVHIQFTAKVARRKAPASRVETPRFEAPPGHRRPDCLSAVEQSCDRSPLRAWSAECPSPQAVPCSAAGETFAPSKATPRMRRPIASAREVAAAA